MKEWSTEEIKDKANSLSEVDRRNESMDRYESGRDGSMLEEFGRKMEAEVLDKRKVEESKKRGFYRQRLPAGVEAGAQTQDIQNKKVVRKLMGKNLRPVQRVQLAAAAKQAGGCGERRDEAAAKNEYYEGFEIENQITRENGR